MNTSARAEAARINGRLGGRGRSRNPLPTAERDQLLGAIARLQRVRLLISSIETVLSSDAEVLKPSEVASLERSKKILTLVRRRVEVCEIPVPQENENPL